MKSRWRVRIATIIVFGALFWGVWLAVADTTGHLSQVTVVGLYWALGTLLYIASMIIRDRRERRQ